MPVVRLLEGRDPTQSTLRTVTEALPLSLLNDYLYCPRRAALKVVEGWREANEHTVRGDVVHELTDLPGYEVAKGVLLWRALPVWSERLGLSGKCDIVEVIPTAPSRGGGRDATQAAFNPQHALLPEANQRRLTLAATIRKDGTLRPVEFKLGRRRQWENDDAQLCAQALCLEEMFSGVVPRGAVFHADSNRRREVEFTPALRETTEQAVAALHALIERPVGDPVPSAVFKPACEACSLYDICLPRVTSESGRLTKAARALFEI